MANLCDECSYCTYDEETEEYYCTINLDEDEMGKYLRSSPSSCHFFSPYNEYKIVEKQN